MVRSGRSSVSVILTLGVSGMVVSDVVGVLELVGVGKGSEWGNCSEGGVVIGISSFGISAG